MSIETIRAALCAAKGPWYPKEDDGPGFYAIYLKASHELAFLDIAGDGLLYVGKTEAGFARRDHFEPKKGHSGGCTLRRSLGAILKHRLELAALPRSSAPSPATFTNFRFDPAGEARLSAWMKGALYIARVPFGQDLASVEARLIEALQPPLNLIGWQNKQAELVKRLRADCANEARYYRALTMGAA